LELFLFLPFYDGKKFLLVEISLKKSIFSYQSDNFKQNRTVECVLKKLRKLF